MDTKSFDMPMKWHKFLVNFSLWAGALICVVSGIQLMTGSHYGGRDVAERVYRQFGNLRSIDMVFGIVYLCLAVLMIYVRFQLAGFKEGAPNKLIITHVIQLAAFLGYAFTVSGTVGMPVGELLDSSSLASIASSAVMIVVNKIYYNKRAHYFGDGAAAATPYPEPTYGSASLAEQHCPKCGAKADPDDVYCVNCGTKLK